MQPLPPWPDSAAPLLLIAGGDGKQQDFAPLREAFSGKVRRVLLIGRDAAQIEMALQGICDLERCATLEAAVIAAARAAQPGDNRAAVAGLREPGHVPRLCASR